MKDTFLLLLLCLTGLPALASQEVHFVVRAEQIVEADESIARLKVRHVSPDLGEASAYVNRDVAWLKEQVSEFPQFRLENLAYRSWPYSRQKGGETVTEWEVQQDVLLRGQDRPLMTSLLGSVQQKAALTGFEVALSPSFAKKVNDELTDKLLLQVRERADRIAKTLGFTSYRLSSITLGNGRAGPEPRPLLLGAGRGDMVLEGGPEPGSGTTKVEVEAKVSMLLGKSSAS